MTSAAVVVSHENNYTESKRIQLKLRKPTEGPEYQLVSRYIESQLPKPPRGQALTVFIEPRIESGFPDIVAAYWNVATTRRWLSQRRQVNKFDLRVMHYLVLSGETEKSQLRSFFSSGLDASLLRLQQFGMICEKDNRLRPRPLQEIFALRRLIAIEAKITEWQSGLRQALHNTWFASESYLLLPSLPRRTEVVSRARHHGVGVVTHTQRLEDAETAARPERIPRSYVSWLFNEWAWKAPDIAL